MDLSICLFLFINQFIIIYTLSFEVDITANIRE